MKITANKYNNTLLCLFLAAFIIICIIIEPIPQNHIYHDFADKRLLFLVPNAFNALSSVLFSITGSIWVFWLIQNRNLVKVKFLHPIEYLSYMLFFSAIIVAGFASVYYHLAPNNLTIFYDRLAAAIAMMSLLTAIIIERVNVSLGMRIWLPLIIFGAWSIIYWEMSELKGKGDLRLYGLVQGIPSALIPFMLWRYPRAFTGAKYIVAALIFFGIARFTEMLDKFIFILTANSISGHTLKHVFIALAVFYIGYYVKNRKRVMQ